jgi:hypothetical protein
VRSQGWADLYGWKIERADATPLPRQIYAQIRSAILSGALSAGSRLPSSRDLAARLGTARASVIAGYEQLVAEGYAEARPGSGTFVCADLANLICRAPLAGPRRKPRPLRPPARDFSDFERAASAPEERPFTTGRTLVDARTVAAWRKLTHLAVRSLGADRPRALSANDHGHALAHTLDNDNRSSFIAAARSDTTISPSGRPLAVRTPRSQPTTHGFQIPVARRAAPPDPCRPAVSFP